MVTGTTNTNQDSVRHKQRELNQSETEIDVMEKGNDFKDEREYH